MNIKNIKVTLLVFFGLLLLSYAVFSMAEENSGSAMNIALDSDQDGLSDQEEITYGTNPNKADTDGDGYSDGAEVQSGYDPLKPAPGDRVAADNKSVVDSSQQNADSSKNETPENSSSTDEQVNLTQEISSQVASLFSEKSSGNEPISIDDLDTVIQKATDGGVSMDSLPEISDDEITITEVKCKSLSDEECEAKEKEAAIEYLTAVSYIVFNNSPKKIENDEEFNNYFQEVMMNFTLFTSGASNNEFFNDISERAGKTMDELKKIEVPENMLELHKQGLKLSKYGIELNNETELKKTDPISNIVSMSKLRDFIGLTMNFAQSTGTELEKYGIEGLSLGL